MKIPVEGDEHGLRPAPQANHTLPFHQSPMNRLSNFAKMRKMPWGFKFYDEGVASEMRALDASQKASLLHFRDLLNEFGVVGLKMPLSKALGDGLFEFRLQGEETIARVFYCFQGKEVVVYLLAFVKKTQKAPKNLVEAAKKRMKEVKRDRR